MTRSDAPGQRSPDPVRVRRAAAALLAARGGAAPTPGLPADAAPRNAADAYLIQEEVRRQLGAVVGGWKVAMDDAQHGRSAPVFAADLYASPVRITPPPATRVGVEPEIAVRLAHALPPLPAGASYTRAEVTDAIGSAHAAIEIVISRFTTHAGASVLDQLADNISNGGLVLGPALADWRRLDLTALPLTLQLGSRTVHSGRGGHPCGDPLRPLVWLANHLAAADGPGLQAGTIVTTGSCAGLHDLADGSSATVVFEGLGTALLRRG